MNDYDLQNTETEEMTDKNGLDVDGAGILIGIGGLLFGVGMGIKSWITSRKLKKEREKNKLYQEAIRKHQAEIDALKNDREREAYKEQLWEALKGEE